MLQIDQIASAYRKKRAVILKKIDNLSEGALEGVGFPDGVQYDEMRLSCFEEQDIFG